MEYRATVSNPENGRGFGPIHEQCPGWGDYCPNQAALVSDMSVRIHSDVWKSSRVRDGMVHRERGSKPHKRTINKFGLMETQVSQKC